MYSVGGGSPTQAPVDLSKNSEKTLGDLLDAAGIKDDPDENAGDKIDDLLQKAQTGSSKDLSKLVKFVEDSKNEKKEIGLNEDAPGVMDELYEVLGQGMSKEDRGKLDSSRANFDDQAGEGYEGPSAHGPRPQMARYLDGPDGPGGSDY
jgi:hypothetical protein